MKKALIVVGDEYEALYKPAKQFYRQKRQDARLVQCKVIAIDSYNSVTIEVLDDGRTHRSVIGQRGTVSLGQIKRPWAERVADEAERQAERGAAQERSLAVERAAAEAFTEAFGDWMTMVNTKLAPYGAEVNGRYRSSYGDDNEPDSVCTDMDGGQRIAEFVMWADRGLILWMTTRVEATLAEKPGGSPALSTLSDAMIDKLGWSGMGKHFRDGYLRGEFTRFNSVETVTMLGWDMARVFTAAVVVGIDGFSDVLDVFVDRDEQDPTTT